MRIVTADLCDAAGPAVRVAIPVFEAFGGRAAFGGAVCTLRVFEDNSLVRETLQTPGDGRVLVVDGGGSLRCALLGGNLAELAVDNAWAGVVINGCVRDRLEIDALPVAVRALKSVPRASEKRNSGERNVALHIAGIDIRPGDFLYADEDGLIVSATDLLAGGGDT